MCGIFGYIGDQDAAKVVAGGLKRLEYRGYDSWGVAVVADSESGPSIKVFKKVGSIGDFAQALDLPFSKIGIGHTRWATHGGVNEQNAHPHYSSDKSFVLAQNGIVENYVELKASLLKKGYKFISETDTEVIVRLVEDTLKQSPNLVDAIRKSFLLLQGRNTIILLTKSGQIVAARNGSPLVVGLNREAEEIFFSSDTLSFAPFAKEMIVIENGQLISCLDKDLTLYDIKSGNQLKFKIEEVNLGDNKIDKEGFDHFMIKEIYEDPYTIKQLLDQDMTEYQEFAQALKKAKNIYAIASGTAGIAAAQIAFYLRENAKLKAIGLIGADALEYVDLFTKDDLIIAPSQSGETADVLEVLEKASAIGVKIASFVNMQGSTMTRMSDYKFMSRAGPEVCVMSTKIFVSQIAWGYLISKIAAGKMQEGERNLEELMKQMTSYLASSETHLNVKALAKQLLGAKDIFLLGKYQNFNIIKEGMVKLVEGTYKHAHAIPSGDLKHYAITLIEKGVPVIFALSEDKAKFDVINAVNEVKARGGYTVVISSKKEESFDYQLTVPDTGETSAIMNVVPLQLLSYYMTVLLGHNVDKPRNIAKSVTVK